MGESQHQPFQLPFNELLRVGLQGPRETSDGGLIPVRELEERFDQFPLAALLRQSIYSRLAGYEDLNDASRLSADPTFRLMGSKKAWERDVTSTSTLHWFETDLLAREKNLTGLARLNREPIAQAEGVGSPHRAMLNMDSSERPVMGWRRAMNKGSSSGIAYKHRWPDFSSILGFSLDAGRTNSRGLLGGWHETCHTLSAHRRNLCPTSQS